MWQLLHALVHIIVDLLVATTKKCFEKGWSITTATMPSLPNSDTAVRCAYFGLYSVCFCSHDSKLLFGVKAFIAAAILVRQLWTYFRKFFDHADRQTEGWQRLKNHLGVMKNEWKHIAVDAIICLVISLMFREPVLAVIFSIMFLPPAIFSWEEAEWTRVPVSLFFLLSMIISFELKGSHLQARAALGSVPGNSTLWFLIRGCPGFKTAFIYGQTFFYVTCFYVFSCRIWFMFFTELLFVLIK